MDLEYVYLKGNRLLAALNNVQELTWTPKSRFQRLLGSNGSGKSSLLRELSPLSANPAHYFRGGMKESIHRTATGERYRLRSDFSGTKNIFNFVRLHSNGNEEELNPGHTATVYNNLVYQIFHYDKEIHDVVMGKKLFTNMPTNERKAWLTRLNAADYTYATAYFKRLSTRYRDMVGALKTDQNRLLEAKGKIANPEARAILQKEIEELRQETLTLMERCPSPSMTMDQVRETITTSKLRIEKLYGNLRKAYRELKGMFPLPNLTELNQRFQDLDRQRAIVDHQSAKLFEEKQQAQLELRELSSSVVSDRAEIENQLEALQRQVDSLQNDTKFQWGKETPVLAIQRDIHQWMGRVQSWLSTISPDPELSVSTTKIQDLQQQSQSSLNRCMQLRGDVQRFSETIRMQEDCLKSDHEECPRCKHQWHKGFSQSVLDDARHRLEHAQKELEQESQRYEELSEALTFQRDHSTAVLGFRTFVNDFPLFANFYEVIFEDQLYRKDPVIALDLLERYGREITTGAQIFYLHEQIDTCRKSLQMANDEAKVRYDYLVKHTQDCENRIALLYEQQYRLADDMLQIERQIKVIDLAETTREEGQALVQTLHNASLTANQAMAREMYLKLNSELHDKIYQKQEQLRDIDNQYHYIKKLEDGITATQEEVQLLKTAVDALSPREGIIAHGQTNFINQFFSVTNSIISKIWTYDMEILPILPDENGLDLDYRFPFRIKDQETPIEDIELASLGQKEAINLGVIVASIAFLRLDHGPLFLDEFGSHLDHAHKAAAYKAISELLVNSNFSKIFMVSHFHTQYSDLVETDISVLCDANIELPTTVAYNEHMELS